MKGITQTSCAKHGIQLVIIVLSGRIVVGKSSGDTFVLNSWLPAEVTSRLL